MLKKIQEIIAEEMFVSAESIGENTSLEGELKADDINMFDITMNLEEEFGVEIPMEIVRQWVTVKDIMDTLKKFGIK